MKYACQANKQITNLFTSIPLWKEGYKEIPVTFENKHWSAKVLGTIWQNCLNLKYKTWKCFYLCCFIVQDWKLRLEALIRHWLSDNRFWHLACLKRMVKVDARGFLREEPWNGNKRSSEERENRENRADMRKPLVTRDIWLILPRQ